MTVGHLPTVNWRGYEVSRLIVGHNPIKGHSHGSDELDREMGEWFDTKSLGKRRSEQGMEQGVDLLHRCHKQGVNTAQFGRGTFDLLSDAHEKGFAPNWIVTLYADPEGNLGTGKWPGKTVEQELEWFESVRAPLIGYQYFGESTDKAYFNGKLEDVKELIERLKRKYKDRLVGVGTHLAEVVRQIDKEQWDIDFLQTSFYTVYSDRDRKVIYRDKEMFCREDRDKMIEAIGETKFPCIVFKVLGSGRHCETSDQVKEALAFALNNIKKDDVVCVGMWQKHGCQVRDNAQHVREILAE